MWDDLKKLFSEDRIRRLTSPFVSTFLLSLAIVNYDVWLILLSDETWLCKVSLINRRFSWPESMESHRILWPGAVALFYVFIWPGLDIFFYVISQKWSHLAKTLGIKITGETPVTKKEQSELVARWGKEIAVLEEKVVARDKTIGEQRIQLKGMAEQAKAPKLL